MSSESNAGRAAPELSAELAMTYLALQFTRNIGVSLFLAGLCLGVLRTGGATGPVLLFLGFACGFVGVIGAYVVAWSAENRQEYLSQDSG